MAKTRIYQVRKADGVTRLIEATSASQAVRHCAAAEYTAKVANSTDVASAMGAGAKVEKATAEQVEAQTPA